VNCKDRVSRSVRWGHVNRRITRMERMTPNCHRLIRVIRTIRVIRIPSVTPPPKSFNRAQNL